MAEVRVGTCGFGGSRAAYFSRFRLVELQEPFYNLPRLATAARWRVAAPLGFTFTLKAPQLVTHDPSFNNIEMLGDAQRFAARWAA